MFQDFDITKTALYQKLWGEAFMLYDNNDDRADQVWSWLYDMGYAR